MEWETIRISYSKRAKQRKPYQVGGATTIRTLGNTTQTLTSQNTTQNEIYINKIILTAMQLLD